MIFVGRTSLLVASMFVFCSIASASIWAEAPVVDDHENFELLEQQSHHPRTMAHERALYPSDTQPLAHDDVNDQNVERNLSLVNQIQGLQQALQELRGQLDVQAHELKILKQQQLDFYKDIDQRLQQSPHTSADHIPPTPIPQSPSASPAWHTTEDEKKSYLSAYDFISHKDFDQALVSMTHFIQTYPQSGYAANAHYWLGELYMVKKNYTDAISEFTTVMHQFPHSSKASASLLKMGYAFAASGDLNRAKQTLKQVMQTYPDTHAAQLAASKLDGLGHS